jgi:hypothetical protein
MVVTYDLLARDGSAADGLAGGVGAGNLPPFATDFLEIVIVVVICHLLVYLDRPGLLNRQAIFKYLLLQGVRRIRHFCIVWRISILLWLTNSPVMRLANGLSFIYPVRLANSLFTG